MTLLRRIYDELFGPSAWARAEAKRMNEGLRRWQQRIRLFEELVGKGKKA